MKLHFNLHGVGRVGVVNYSLSMRAVYNLQTLLIIKFAWQNKIIRL